MIFRILEDQYAQKSKQSKAADQRFMQLALTLGRRGQGRIWPNPAVGAVVVKDGVIVGRGWTQPGGRPHAEPEALARAGEAARGATLYVTLEPCSHFGKSPPCADAIIAAGIARVVSAIEDPNPEVAGQGHARLRAAGITVDIGLGAAEAARDHAGHFRRVRDKRPHVILKLAVSSDDKIAAAGHKPVAITGEAARARVHLLRAQCDAVLVGIGTVLADDPLLTCRLPGMEARSPVRVVLDPELAHSRHQPAGSFRARDAAMGDDVEPVAEAPAAMKLGAAGAQVIRVATTTTPRPGLDLAGRAACAGREGHHAAFGGRRRAGGVILCRRRPRRRSLAAARPRCDRRRRCRRAGRIAAVGYHRSRPRSNDVLAKACKRILSRSTSVPECSPALSPTSARSSA